MTTNPIAPQLIPDVSGCKHVVVRVMGKWNCKNCWGGFREVETLEGMRLILRMQRAEAENHADALAVIEAKDEECLPWEQVRKELDL